MLCVGLIVGYIAMVFLQNAPIWRIMPLFIMPCLIDGALQYYTKYESTNYKRAIFGFFAGVGIRTSLYCFFGV